VAIRSGTWDDDTREIAEACIDAAESHDLVFHFHTSAGGTSDINNFVPLVEKYGKRIKIYLVHFGGGVSGHIKLVRSSWTGSSRDIASTATRPGRSASALAG
jgi:hypothetical protein